MGLLDDVKNDFETALHRVENEGSLKWLEELANNCANAGIGNSNVEIATRSPAKWLPDLIPDIIENVDYVTISPIFELKSIENGQVCVRSVKVSGGEIFFDTIQDVKDFLKSKKYKMIALYTIANHVDLKAMKSYFRIRHAEWEDVRSQRNKKIDEIMN